MKVVEVRAAVVVAAAFFGAGPVAPVAAPVAAGVAASPTGSSAAAASAAMPRAAIERAPTPENMERSMGRGRQEFVRRS